MIMEVILPMVCGDAAIPSLVGGDNYTRKNRKKSKN